MSNPQTAFFPTAPPTDLDLMVASDNAQTTLTSSASGGDTTIDVTSTTGFNTPCIIVIDSEIIVASSQTSNTFQGCIRGFAGTSATGHSISANVYGYFVSYHHNQMSAEVQALSGWLIQNEFAGLRLQENLLLWSENFTSPYWTKLNGVTASLVGHNGPNNETPAYSVLDGNITGVQIISAAPYNIAYDLPYVFSVYAQYNNNQWMVIGQEIDGGDTTRRVWFDIQNGLLGNAGANAVGTIVPVGGGWYRCLVSIVNNNNGNLNFEIGIAPSNGTVSYTPSATQQINIWGASVRNGTLSSPQMYLPTTGTAQSNITGDIVDEGDLG